MPSLPERIPYLSAEDLPEGVPPANMLRMWAHSPAVFRPVIALGTACISEVSISVKLRQLIALYCAQHFKSDYIWARHINDGREAGLTQEQIDALIAHDIRGSVWSKQESTLLVFLAEVVRSPEVQDDVFSELRCYFDERDVVEILTIQGFYYTWSRVGTVLRVSVDENVKGDYQKAKKWAEQ